jgi:predicted enzyme related to lactoylglutathione lyase
MELAAIRIFATDLDAAARFYETVVGLVRVETSPEAIIFGDGPTVVIEAADEEAVAEGLVGRFTGVSFATDDADALYDELTRRGVPTYGRPEQQPWGGRLLHADDPTGNTITFVQFPTHRAE